jgi:hypothetical protein
MAKGGFTGAVPPRETSPEEYSGVWDITEQYGEQKAGSWPFQADDCAPKSLRLNSADSAYLSKTPSAAGNRRTWTWSGWVKIADITAQQTIFSASTNSTNRVWLRFNSGPLEFQLEEGDVQTNLYTNAVYRDPSAWYHIVVAVDTTQATTSNRSKIYVNGEQVTSFSTEQYPAQNYQTYVNNTNVHRIGSASWSLAVFADSYMADIHLIDGQALEPTDFGFFDGAGIWQPKRFTGDYSSGPVYSNNSSTLSNPVNAFDGNTSTFSYVNNSGALGQFTGLSIPVPANSTMRVRVDSGSNGNIKLNGSNVASFTGGAAQWVTVASANIPSLITSIGIQSSSGPGIAVVELNGVALTDASVGRNSFHLDFSDGVKDQSGLGNDWTGNNVGVNRISLESPTASFTIIGDGMEQSAPPTNGVAPSNKVYLGGGNNGTMTFDPPLTANTQIRWYGYTDGATGATVQADGGSAVNVTGGGANSWNFTYHDLGVTSLSKLTITGVSGGTFQTAGFEIDGTWAPLSAHVGGSDFFVDSPVNGNEASTGAGGERRGNYATLNPLAKDGSTTLSNGNLDLSSSNYGNNTATFFLTSGKWYWEGQGTGYVAAICGKDGINWSTSISATGSNSIGWWYLGAVYWDGGNNTGSTTYGSSDIVGTALDMDAGVVYFYKNGSLVYTVTFGSGTVPDLSDGAFPCYNHGQSSGTKTAVYNFGQRSFSYAPPAGYSPLATSFLPEPTIKRGDEAVDVALYTGNDTQRDITGLGFSPDLVWIKKRSSSGNHSLMDTVRGATKNLVPNDSQGEGTEPGYLNAFLSNGFSIGTSGIVNDGNSTYVGWAWDAGDATTTIAAGALNSSAYDQSQTWSSSLTSTQTFNLATTRAFDGDLSTLAATANATTANILFTKTFTNVTKLRVYMDHATSYRVRINGGTWHTDSSLGASSNASWRDLTSIIPANGTVNSIESDTGGQNNGVNWSAVEVNGVLLVDSGVSVTNVPSIATTVRANPTTGFSIVTATQGSGNSTWGHGLNAKPEFIIMKARNASFNWYVSHSGLDNQSTKFLILNSTNSVATNANWFASTEPTSSVITSKAGGMWNQGDDFVAYCFAPVDGYSSFGSYQGDGSSDGPFVYTGFKIALLLVKSSSDASNWRIVDNARNVHNPVDANLYPNLSNAEASQTVFDFLSNGFKARGTAGDTNQGGRTYIYAAFAEHPFASNCRAR